MSELVLMFWGSAVLVLDLRHRRLPNALTLGGLAVGLAMLLFTGTSALGQPPGVVWAGAGLALLLTLPAYAFGLLGAGDVKLAAAIALLSGLFHFLVVYSLAAFLALGMLLAARHAAFVPLRKLLTVYGSEPGEAAAARVRSVPFGAALGGGLVLMLLARLAGVPV